MENFSPISASIGGFLIGVSALLLLLFNGRVAGISGIVAGATTGSYQDSGWRWCFIVGIVVAPILYQIAYGETVVIETTASMPILIIGGLLVGYGTRLGSGCTSGHGVCGLSRLSFRSFVAVLTFMGTAVGTVAVVRLLTGGLM